MTMMVMMKMKVEDDGRPAPETVASGGKIATEEAAERFSESSSCGSETEESPRSVVKCCGGGGGGARVHSQVLRIIREEESCMIGEDEAARCYSHGGDRDRRRRYRLDLVLVSRSPILPCSPLSGKVSSTDAVKALR